jgi:hypothetical protein
MTNSPPVWEEDGTVRYRASYLGGCLTALAAARQGLDRKEPTGKVAAVFQAGHDAEDRFFDLYPHLAQFRQMEAVLHITDKIKVVGHLDAWVGRVVEVKSQSGAEWDAWTWESWDTNPLWQKYAWQVSACMLAMGGNIGATVYRFNRETEKVSLEAVAHPLHTHDEITERILTVETMAMEELEPCASPSFFCDFPHLHPGPELLDDPELQELVNDYIVLNNRSKAAGAQLREIRDRIVKYMEGIGKEKVMLLSGVTVSRSEYDTQDHIVKGSHQVRLTVNAPTDK